MFPMSYQGMKRTHDNNIMAYRSRSNFVTHLNRYSRLKSAENRANFVRSRTSYIKVKITLNVLSE